MKRERDLESVPTFGASLGNSRNLCLPKKHKLRFAKLALERG